MKSSLKLYRDPSSPPSPSNGSHWTQPFISVTPKQDKEAVLKEASREDENLIMSMNMKLEKRATKREEEDEAWEGITNQTKRRNTLRI